MPLKLSSSTGIRSYLRAPKDGRELGTEEAAAPPDTWRDTPAGRAPLARTDPVAAWPAVRDTPAAVLETGALRRAELGGGADG